MIQIPQKQKNDNVKISVDLWLDNYNKLVKLKRDSHFSVGKIINMILAESLTTAKVKEMQKDDVR